MEEDDPPIIDLKTRYAISERIALVRDFQRWAELVQARFPGTSNFRIALIVDDVLLGSEMLVRVGEGEPQRYALSGVLHPKTIGNILKRDLTPSLAGVHLQTVQVLDAFLQVLRFAPPDYLDG